MNIARTPFVQLGIALLAALFMSAMGHAEDAEKAEPAAEELSQKATDPTASLMSFQANDLYTSSYHGTDGDGNQILVRAAIPFQFLGTNNIFRLSAPYITSSPSGNTGLGDI